MHFEILIEDQSGKKALDILMPKIIEKNIHIGLLVTAELVVFPKTSKVTPMSVTAFCLIACLSCSND